MTEKSCAYLSPASTEVLINGINRQGWVPSSRTARRLEKELDAYLPFEQATFGGVLYHCDGKGPEKPYFMPENTNWQPEVQAIARIGVQYHYWDMLHSALKSSGIDPVRSISILILIMNSDGSSFLPVSADPGSVRQVAKELGHKKPWHPRYVIPINYGGDGDFYGNYRNNIFPMRIRTKGGTKVTVTKEALGIPAEVVQQVWNSWNNFSCAKDRNYHEAVVGSIPELHSSIGDIIQEGLQRGRTFSGSVALMETLLLKDGTMSVGTLDRVQKIIDNRARKLMAGDPQLVVTAGDHARNLATMYETAKRHCQDIYHY